MGALELANNPPSRDDLSVLCEHLYKQMLDATPEQKRDAIQRYEQCMAKLNQQPSQAPLPLLPPSSGKAVKKPAEGGQVKADSPAITAQDVIAYFNTLEARPVPKPKEGDTIATIGQRG